MEPCCQHTYYRARSDTNQDHLQDRETGSGTGRKKNFYVCMNLFKANSWANSELKFLKLSSLFYCQYFSLIDHRCWSWFLCPLKIPDFEKDTVYSVYWTLPVCRWLLPEAPPDEQEEDNFGDGCFSPTQKQLWNLFENPHHSRAAKVSVRLI